MGYWLIRLSHFEVFYSVSMKMCKMLTLAKCCSYIFVCNIFIWFIYHYYFGLLHRHWDNHMKGPLQNQHKNMRIILETYSSCKVEDSRIILSLYPPNLSWHTQGGNYSCQGGNLTWIFNVNCHGGHQSSAIQKPFYMHFLFVLYNLFWSVYMLLGYRFSGKYNVI